MSTRLADRDAYVFFKQSEDKTWQEEYEALRRKQRNGYKLTLKEIAFIKQMRERGRGLSNQRAFVAFNRHFS